MANGSIKAKKAGGFEPSEMTHVAVFAANGFAFNVDETEDTGTLTSHLAVLSKATFSLTRLVNACASGVQLDAEEIEIRSSQASEGIEFLSSICACLSDDLARRAGVHHG